MTTSNLVDVVRHYQRSIERHQEDQDRLLHCVTKLYSLPIKVEHLQETGIGKTVNSLRKFNGEVGVAAKTLVTKWKAMVAAEEEPGDTKSTDVVDNKTKRRSSSDEDQDENKQSNSSSGEEQHRQSLTVDSHKDISTDHNHRKSTSQGQKKHSEHKRSRSSSHRSPPKTNDEKPQYKISSEKSHNRGRSGDREPRKEHRKAEEKKHKESTTKIENKSSSSYTKRKRDNSCNRDLSKECNLQKEHEKERCKDHRSERDKHKSSKDNKDRSSKSKEDKHGHHNSHKKEHKRSDKHKSHGSLSTTSTKRSSSLSKNIAEHTGSSSAKRLRNEDTDENEASPPQTKITKVKSKSKHQQQVSGNPSSNEEDEGDGTGFDSTMGANFADVLGMLNVPMSSGKKSKKTVNKSNGPMNLPSSFSSSSTSALPSTSTRSPVANSSSTKRTDKTASSTSINGVKKEVSATRKPDLLSSSAKLEPLDPSIVLELPTISTNYKPMPLNQTVMDVVFSSTNNAVAGTSATSTYKPSLRAFDESEALVQSISSKTMRTKIYSGARPGQILQVPTLFDLCIRVLQKNIDALEYTGGVPFDVLRPVLDRATPQQLLTFEDYNPYLMEDSDELWKLHVQRHHRTQRRQEMETWREMFLRCQEEKDRRLSVLAKSIKQQQKINEAPVRKTQLAFVDSMVKPPRGVQRRQDQYGTRGKMIATPAARVPALSSVTPNAAKPGDARLRVMASARDTAQMAVAPARPKKAPLMAKTLQFIRGRQKR